MDNELDGRLRRLEAGQGEQGDQLTRLVAGQEELRRAVLSLTQLLTAADPEGQAMHALLKDMTAAIERNTTTLEARRCALPASLG